MTDEFATPAQPGGVDWQPLMGSLLLIEPMSNETGIATVHGPANAVRASVAVLDGAHAGTTHEDALVFPKVLQGQLRTRIGQKVLGRLSQGLAKAGQTAPWLLQEATPADIDVARRWLAQQKPRGLAQPAAPPSTQVPGQWAQQPATSPAQPPF